MFELFTDRARRVIPLAQERARKMGHNNLGTEHLLLGLLAEGEGIAAEALQLLGISLDAARRQVQDIIGPGTRSPGGHIPFTPRAKKVLQASMRESQRLGDDYIGTEHLLLGLLAERECVAAQVLVRLGVDLDQARMVVIGLVPAGADSGERSETDRMRREIARLRRLLLRHGIDPDAPEDDAG